MADDSEIPPLEDMTEVLKKADLIREQRFGSESQIKETKTEDAKKRAKVTKKNSPAVTTVTKEESDSQDKLSNGDKKKVPDSGSKVSSTTTNSQGMFGGMKKGFLFSSSSKQSSKSTSNTVTNSKNTKVQCDTGMTQKSSTASSTQKEEMPFISPSGKTESGLSFDEVQQAMSEAKGLLDNQDWITEDFLNKIEKNETLLKRFSDPHFMSALQEFQTNPQAAMEKYKGNTEVETFLQEFCGILGDHFTHLGSSSSSNENSSHNQKSTQKSDKSESKSQQKSTGPKIVEIGNDDESERTSKAKIVELPDKEMDNLASDCNKLTTASKTNDKSGPNIRLHDEKNRADIQEMPSTEDEAVKEVLNDPKIMETLMDPKIMGLIKTLREDPVKGQSVVDNADSDLRDKIRFLVSKGLLQFQMS